MDPRPPRVLAWLLSATLPDGAVRDGIAGDLEELYVKQRRRRRRWAADVWYARHAAGAVIRYLPRRIAGPQGGGGVDSIVQSARMAVRRLGRARGYVAVVVLTLGLGVGANATVFSLVNGVLLEPLAYPGPERIISVSEDNPDIDMPIGFASIPNYEDWRDRNTVFGAMALFRGRSASVGTDDLPEYAYSAFVTSDFFRVYGATPMLGRGFLPEEDVNDARVAVLSHGLWTRGFAADPGAVGRAVLVDGSPYEIVGVMPTGFGAPGEWMGPDVVVQLWRPFPTSMTGSRINRSYSAVGRLRDGVTIEAARAEMESIDAELREVYPESNDAWRIQLFRWSDVVVGEFRPTLLLLFGAMILVLVIVSANIANLAVNRVLTRDRDLATCEALGAGRNRVVGGVLLESAILAILGSGTGLALSNVGLKVVKALEPGRLPRIDAVGIDGAVLVFGFGIAFAAAMAFGGAAALTASSFDPAVRLRTSRGDRHSWRWRVRAGLAVVQLVTSFALLAGAQLLARSHDRLVSTDLGFDPVGLTAATVALSWGRVIRMEERTAFSRDVLAGLEALPGVESAAMINSLPLSGSNSYMGIIIDGLVTEEDRHVVAVRGVSPGYFETMRLPLAAGRGFTSADVDLPFSAVVNRRMAERYWPGEDPVGREVRLRGWRNPMTIVGVAADVRHWGPDADYQPELYFPYSAEMLTSKSFVVRWSGEPVGLAAGIRGVIRRVDPEQPLREIRSMEEWAAEATATARFQAAIMSVGAGLATVLACVGLFAALAALVGERTREIAIRMAIGARSRGVLLDVLRRAGSLILLGVVGGVIGTLMLGRVMERLLFGIEPDDPAILLNVAAGFLVVSLTAAYVPARRAASVDPARVLRGE